MNPINIAMVTYMRALQKLLKPTIIYKLICGYCNGCLKNHYYLQDLEACITMDVKNQQLFIKPICKYYIFEMASWKLK
jgi:hypothetical protein